MDREEYLQEQKIKGFILTYEEAYHKVSKENNILQKKIKNVIKELKE